MSKLTIIKEIVEEIECSIDQYLLPASEFGDSPEYRSWRKSIAKAALKAVAEKLKQK